MNNFPFYTFAEAFNNKNASQKVDNNNATNNINDNNIGNVQNTVLLNKMQTATQWNEYSKKIKKELTTKAKAEHIDNDELFIFSMAQPSKFEFDEKEQAKNNFDYQPFLILTDKKTKKQKKADQNYKKESVCLATDKKIEAQSLKNKFIENSPKLSNPELSNPELSENNSVTKKELPWYEYLNESETSIESDNSSFNKAMFGVTPLQAKGRELNLTSKQKKSGNASKNARAQGLIEGKIEFSLEYSSDFVTCHLLGLDSYIVEQLRAGSHPSEARIDLHGQKTEQAYASLLRFIRHSYQRNLQNIIVVTGRGANSASGISVLRDRIQTWLTRDPFKRVLLGFCTAKPQDGGAGALYVLLRKYKKSREKILWDRNISLDELDS